MREIITSAVEQAMTQVSGLVRKISSATDFRQNAEYFRQNAEYFRQNAEYFRSSAPF